MLGVNVLLFHRLICSDALARGIDVPNIDCVISYDAPKFIKNYIHRIGRTGRAGRQGTAITMVEDRQVCATQIIKDLWLNPLINYF